MLKWLKRSVGGGLSNNTDAAGYTVPFEALDLTDPQTIASFKDIAENLRLHKPVCPVTSGGFLLLNQGDVKDAFSNKKLSNQPSRFSALAPKNAHKYTAASMAANIPPFLDGSRHVEIRKWLSRCFFERLRSFKRQIPAIAKTHVEQIECAAPRLLVEDIARGFVVDTIGQFVGVNLSPKDMKQFTGALFRLFAPAANPETFTATNTALEKARVTLIKALKQRRSDQMPCLLNSLDNAALPNLDGVNRDILIVDNALLILADGVENVEAMIGNVMMCADQRSTEITPGFIRETINQNTPGQTIARIATQSLQIGGEKVAVGTPVFLSLASANEAADPTKDFSFGMGRHKCLGEQLAIEMITEFCKSLTERDPQIDVSDLHYSAMFGHKWPRGVTLTLTH